MKLFIGNALKAVVSPSCALVEPRSRYMAKGDQIFFGIQQQELVLHK